MDQTLCLRHANFKVHWTLTEATRPHRATWEGRGRPGSYARTSYRLTPDGDGTHFEYENEFKAPGGLLGTAASRVVVGGVPEREAQAFTATTQSAARNADRQLPCAGVSRADTVCDTFTLLRSHTHMADFLDEKRKEIQARLKELKPLVEEYQRARGGRPGARRARQRRAAPRPPPAPAPRRARARPGPPRHRRQARAAQGRRHARRPGAGAGAATAPASPSPSSPRRWASSRTTSTA